MSIHTTSVDPKLLSAWLRSQFLSAADVTSSSLGGTNGDAPDFSALLQLLTAQSGNGTAAMGPYDGAAANAPFGLDPLAGLRPLVRSGPTAEAAGVERAEAPADVDAIVRQASERYGVDPALVHAVIRVESGYDSKAVSSAGAKGLMQLMDATAASLGVADSFDPVQNVNGGTRFLSFLLTKYNGNEGVALAAYNAGPGRVDRLGIRTDADLLQAMERLPEETQAYVGKVLRERG